MVHAHVEQQEPDVGLWERNSPPEPRAMACMYSLHLLAEKKLAEHLHPDSITNVI
jgi:hypothetical protein